MIQRYRQTGEIMNYRDPSPRQTEIIKKHGRGKWCLWADVKVLVESAEQAEKTGWAKYRSTSGAKMVVMTQDDLDELLVQAKKTP